MDPLEGEFILNGEKATSSTISPEPSTPHKAHSTTAMNKPHFFTSYCKNPHGVSFGEQEENENILLLLRRHVVINFPWIAASITLLFLPFIFPVILRFFPFPLPEQSTILLFISFYYLVVFGFIILNFTLWYFHVGIITNKRVIDIDLSGILYRQISEAKVKSIEDVTYDQVGFITSLFNYGNVHVQTAGTEENIEYDRVPKPSQVADIIGDISH